MVPFVQSLSSELGYFQHLGLWLYGAHTLIEVSLLQDQAVTVIVSNEFELDGVFLCHRCVHHLSLDIF